MSWRLAKAAAAVVLLVLLPIGAASASDGSRLRVTATVERIVDGDTLVLRGGARVRLLQIDAPEAGAECYAAASARELARLARPGARVVLEADPKLDRIDRYERLLRYIHVRAANVNVELVRRGAATPWFYEGERGRYAGALLRATSAARSAKSGMWGACRVSWNPFGPVETRPR
jgi:micrococcal nuclease